MLLALGTCALAADKTVSAAITYRGISIIVNGTKIVPQDANGNPVEPFIMDGTTYLPVRAIAGALGLDVSWNGATSTVILTSGGETICGSGRALATNGTKRVDITYRDIAIEYNGDRIYATTADGNPVEPFIMDGTTYLPVRGVANALGLDVSWDGATSTVTLEGDSALCYTWVVKSEKSVYVYDDAGRYEETVTYEYDDKGRTTLIKTSGGDIENTVRIFYNADGSRAREERTGNYGKSTVYYEKSADGLTERSYSVGDIEWEKITTYDASGRMMSFTSTDESGTIRWVYTTAADGSDLAIKYEGGYEVSRTVTTTTDRTWVEVTTGRGAGHCETVWGDEGIVRESCTYTDPDYTSYTTEHLYNSGGFEWKEITRYADGNSVTREYTYDDDYMRTSERVTTTYGYNYTVTYEYMRIACTD